MSSSCLVAQPIEQFTGTASFNAADALIVEVDYGVWDPGTFPVGDPSNGLEFVYIYQATASTGLMDALSINLPDDSNAANADFVRESGIEPSSWEILDGTALATFEPALSDQSAILLLTSPNEPTFGTAEVLGEALADRKPIPVPVDLALTPGDANLDGAVDAVDLAPVRNGFGQTGGWTAGNFTRDPDIDAADLAIVRNFFGSSTGGARVTPEPQSLLLLAVGGAMILPRKGRARKLPALGTPGRVHRFSSTGFSLGGIPTFRYCREPVLRF